MSGFDAFLDRAWTDHADDPAGVAARLEASLDRVDETARVAPYARLAMHVFGEHLGEWERGIRVLRRLRERADGDDAARAVDRSVAALAYGSGDASALEGLVLDDRIAALALAASAFAGLGDPDRALDAYARALDAAAPGLADGSPALRALAAAGNNLAAALEERADRTQRQTRGMVDAARAALVYWKRAGGWLEEERAEYRLSCSLLCAGEAAEAAERARRCLAICDRHDAPAFERFYGTLALARADRARGDRASFDRLRDRARALRDAMPDDEREACERDLAALGAQAA
jgi:hypothetical protein